MSDGLTSPQESGRRTADAPSAAMLALFQRLMGMRHDARWMASGQAGIPVSNYVSTERCEREKQTLFRRYPLMVAHESEMPRPGMCLPLQVAGQPVLLTRDLDGRFRAFLNVCRHRGMQLQAGDDACERRTLVCPYHGWTYGLDGGLRHVPHDEFFPDLSTEKSGLVELPCGVTNGLVFVVPAPDAATDQALDAAGWLDGLEADFRYLGYDRSVLYRKVGVTCDCNWKLLVDAFLEVYHVRVLHRDSIYPFFEDSVIASDCVGRHLRALVSRRSMDEAKALAPEQWNLRDYGTFVHYVFPNSIHVQHPDYSSVLTFYPLDPDHTRWIHHMLIPRARHTEAERSHWEKTFRLIEETVFEREDIPAAEGVQRGLRSGANANLTMGRAEFNIAYFHRQIQAALDETG